MLREKHPAPCEPDRVKDDNPGKMFAVSLKCRLGVVRHRKQGTGELGGGLR